MAKGKTGTGHPRSDFSQYTATLLSGNHMQIFRVCGSKVRRPGRSPARSLERLESRSVLSGSGALVHAPTGAVDQVKDAANVTAIVVAQHEVSGPQLAGARGSESSASDRSHAL